MERNELIKALRYCTDNEKQDRCDECQYLHNGMCHTMLSDAAYALEADEKLIVELVKNIEHWKKDVIKLRSQLQKIKSQIYDLESMAKREYDDDPDNEYLEGYFDGLHQGAKLISTTLTIERGEQDGR